MKKYEIPFTFVFSGKCLVNANSKDEAKEIVEQNMCACCPRVEDGGCADIIDYDIDCHAITSIEQ